MDSSVNQRAATAKELFDFPAEWRAPTLPGMTSEAVRSCIVRGGEPIVAEMVNGKVSSNESILLRELAACRRTLCGTRTHFDDTWPGKLQRE